MDLSGAVAREVRSHAARRRRRDVYSPGAERRRRARRGHRPRVLDLLARAVAAGTAVLRARQPRAGDSWPHAVHGDARRSSDRARRQERPPGLERHDDGAQPEAGYAFTVAPLVVKDKVIVGSAGGEFGVRGFLAAFDAATGKEAWRFNTIPGPGEPATEPGRAIHGSAAAPACGSPARTIPI